MIKAALIISHLEGTYHSTTTNYKAAKYHSTQQFGGYMRRVLFQTIAKPFPTKFEIRRKKNLCAALIVFSFGSRSVEKELGKIRKTLKKY